MNDARMNTAAASVVQAAAFLHEQRGDEHGDEQDPQKTVRTFGTLSSNRATYSRCRDESVRRQRASTRRPP